MAIVAIVPLLAEIRHPVRQSQCHIIKSGGVGCNDKGQRMDVYVCPVDYAGLIFILFCILAFFDLGSKRQENGTE